MALKTALLTWLCPGLRPGLTPLSDVVTLPFLPLRAVQPAAFCGVTRQISADTERVGRCTAPGHPLHASIYVAHDKETGQDHGGPQGLKLGCSPGPDHAFKTLGAVPVLLGMPDCYMAMQKGTIDGWHYRWGSLRSSSSTR
jgi:ABC-type nitrate/sulfonate/bicarbonate transport system substrate-binding protein